MSAIPNRRQFLSAAISGGLALTAASAGAQRAANPRKSDPLLPQDDPQGALRARQLARTQQQYQYNYQYISPLAMLDRVPLGEQFSVQWLVQVGSRVMDLVENFSSIAGDQRDQAKLQRTRKLFNRLTNSTTVNVPALIELLREGTSFSMLQGRPESLDDYGDLFRTIGLPPIAADFQDDFVFAWMRLAGPNPLVLHQVGQLDERFPVTETIYQSVLPGDSLAAAAAEGRLFLVDYQLLELVETSSFPVGQKYLFAPLALFVVDRDTRQLRPVAIQSQQTPGPDNPIFTPFDGVDWLIAKTIVEIADGNYHEMISHLGRTHLYMEPFAIATARQLADRHPLNILLRPHFEGTLAINDLAQSFLIADRGPVSQLLAGTIESSQALAGAGIMSYALEDAWLPESFAARGVDDVDLLPDYPFRDDSLLYWDAISRWVGDYTSVYYQSDADVVADYELTAWVHELRADDGGRLLGLPSSIGSVADLCRLLTVVVYTSSVQHAAVNYPQFDLMSYVPNMPLAGYSPGPPIGAGATEQDLLDLLPPLGMASEQLAILYILGTVQFTTLGEYSTDHMCDPRVAEALAAFQSELNNVGQVIDHRNLSRRPYTFLERQGIPQSINI